MKHIVGLSGGKDSTALALELAEREPRDYEFICTPTGNESPEMEAHWRKLEGLLGKNITRLTNGTLESWMQKFKALPNGRMRWCTRLLKIVPTIEYIKANQPAVLYVGLRADEETREGIYGDEVESRFPFREWGWGVKEVLESLERRGVTIPERTDCEWCYAQQIVEWYLLLYKRPESFEKAIDYEREYQHTFRSPSRDTWPAELEGLRQEFIRSRRIRGSEKKLQLKLYQIGEDENTKCRVCSL
jgi:PP-loop superfamily ATP-utilizing enzyme